MVAPGTGVMLVPVAAGVGRQFRPGCVRRRAGGIDAALTSRSACCRGPCSEPLAVSSAACPPVVGFCRATDVACSVPLAWLGAGERGGSGRQRG